jgi:hypothetical protein
MKRTRESESPSALAKGSPPSCSCAGDSTLPGGNGSARRVCPLPEPPFRSRNLECLFLHFRNELARRHGETRRRLAGTGRSAHLLAWATAHLDRHFRLPPSLMHRWMAAELDRLVRRRGARLNVLGPRGSAKSTLGTLAYPLRAALEGTEPYIWIVSDTHDQAETHLKNLKTELVENAALAAAYPDAAGRGPVWRGDAIVLRNGTAIEAYGTG